MSVTAVTEDFEGRAGTIDLDGTRNYTRVFFVRTDTPADTGPTIFNAANVPSLWAVYPDDPWAYCIKKSCRPKDDMCFWSVNVEYSTKLPIDPAEASENPLSRPPTIRISCNKFNKVVLEDYDGEPVVNSAGDPFEGGFELTDSRPVLSITWNEAASSFDYSTFTGYMNKVNSNSHFGFDANALLVSDLSADFAFENGVAFWKCSATIEVNADGWNPVRMIDQGYRYLDGGDRHQIRVDGQVVTSPALLDTAGTPLDPGQPAQYLEFKGYQTTSFAGIG